MFIEESLWIKEKLSQLDLPSGSWVLNIGSSTEKFRRSIQSHIDQNIFSPLRERGFHIIHMDKKSEEGIDVVGDIESPDIVKKVGRNFDLVLCTSLLEHVTDIERTVENMVRLVCKMAIS